jgi:hypothetical protein
VTSCAAREADRDPSFHTRLVRSEVEWQRLVLIPVLQVVQGGHGEQMLVGLVEQSPAVWAVEVFAVDRMRAETEDVEGMAVLAEDSDLEDQAEAAGFRRLEVYL